MGSDYYFRMGATHSICQDYALAGESNGVAYAVLSDGCSGIPNPEQPGSPYTDIGARFLTLSALRNLGAIADMQYPLTKIIADADAIRRQASLPSDSLDATLLMVTEKNGMIATIMTGDGVLVHRSRNGSIQYTRRKFENGMPGYLNYEVKTSAVPEYLSKVTKYEEIYGVKIESGYEEQIIEFPNSSINSSFRTFPLYRDECDLVILFSDGIESFVDANNQPIPVGDVLDVILDLPKMAGQFLNRSCNWLLKKHCVSKGWKHIDDFSCAGIYLP